MTNETKPTVTVLVSRQIRRADFLPMMNGDEVLHSVNGTVEILRPLDPDKLGVEITADAIAAAYTDGSLNYDITDAYGEDWITVTVTRTNPAYLGPDVLFGDPPPATITETVTL